MSNYTKVRDSRGSTHFFATDDLGSAASFPITVDDGTNTSLVDHHNATWSSGGVRDLVLVNTVDADGSASTLELNAQAGSCVVDMQAYGVSHGARLQVIGTDSGTNRAELLFTVDGNTLLDILRTSAGTDKVGFFGTAAAAKPTVTGSRGGNAALASLLTGLANLGLITDSSTA